MRWDWTYVRQELAAAFTGEVAPGVSFEVDGSDPRAASVRVRLRVLGGYTYGFMSTHAKDSVGYLGIILNEEIASEIDWTLNGYISFVTDREELRDLCAQVRGSLTLADIIQRLSDEVSSLENRIASLLVDIGAEGDERNVRRVRAFLNRNCLEVTSE